MKPRNIHSKHAIAAFARYTLLPITTLLAACSADTLVMGENGTATPPPPPPDSRCRESTRLSGDVLIDTQDQLDTLEGCEHVDGSLTISFEAIDLRALHALTSVRSTLNIAGGGEAAIASLAGLEALETVGNLEISGLRASDLSPLGNLEFMTIGDLTLKSCPNLSDLDGLAQLKGVRHLWLECSALETIAPLALPEQLADLWFFEGRLTRLTEDLGVREISGSLVVRGSQLRNLDAFSSLTSVGGIELRENALLENLDATASLQRAGRIVVIENPNISRLPDYTELGRLGELWINDNDRLIALPPFRAIYTFDLAAPPSPFVGRSPTIEINGNTALTAIALPPAWANGTSIIIGNNAALTRVDLPSLSYLEYLGITDNPALTAVTFDSLDRAFALQVSDNPRLDDSVFASVRSLEKQVANNARLP